MNSRHGTSIIICPCCKKELNKFGEHSYHSYLQCRNEFSKRQLVKSVHE